nr:MAG TPA: hypothetical protein [Caudoviricetes sp.]
MDLFSNDYRKHSYKRNIYNEEVSRVGFYIRKTELLLFGNRIIR